MVVVIFWFLWDWIRGQKVCGKEKERETDCYVLLPPQDQDQGPEFLIPTMMMISDEYWLCAMSWAKRFPYICLTNPWITFLVQVKKLRDEGNLPKIIKQMVEPRNHLYPFLSQRSLYISFSSHVLMWELDHKEGWALKNWRFQTVVLQKTLESPLDSKEIKSVNPKGNQSWIFIGRTDAEAETKILWSPDVKSP